MCKYGIITSIIMAHKALINVKEEYFTLLCNKKLFILSNYSLDEGMYNKGK